MTNQNKLFIPVLLGTAREGRLSEGPAKYIFEKLKTLPEIRTEFFDVKDFLLGFTHSETADNPLAKKWRKIVEELDALVVVSPEYNHGVPGELKILLDCAYDEYEKKPVGIVSVSSGGFGGVRMIEKLRPSLIKLGLVPIKNAVSFSRVQDLFENGNLKDESKFEKPVKLFFKELVWFAKTLSMGRKGV